MGPESFEILPKPVSRKAYPTMPNIHSSSSRESVSRFHQPYVNLQDVKLPCHSDLEEFLVDVT